MKTLTSAVCAVLLAAGLASQEPKTPESPETHETWEQKLERASGLFSQGSTAEATELARDALAMAVAEYQPDDEELLTPLLFLSSLLLITGDHDAAEPYALRYREITEKKLAQVQSSLATVLKHFGAIYMQQERLEEAQEVYERAVEISEETAGPDDPETARHVGNLAAILLRRGKQDEAEALFDRALAIWAEQPAPDPVYTAADLRNLAELRLLQQDTDAALQLYREAVAIQEGAFGPSDPRLVKTLRDYARVLREAGLAEEAVKVEARLPGE